MRKRRIGEQAEGHEPIARAAVSSGQILTDNAKVVASDVRELRAARAIPHRPDVRRSGLQPLVDTDISPSIQFYAALLESDPLRVWNAPCRDQNVAALKLPLAASRAYRDPHFVSRSPVNVEDLGREQKLDAFVAEDSLHLSRNVGILSAHQLGPRLDDGHAAAEATIRLRHFESDISASEDDQVCGQVIEFERLNMGERLAGFETGNRRDCCAGSKVEKHPIAG